MHLNSEPAVEINVQYFRGSFTCSKQRLKMHFANLSPLKKHKRKSDKLYY